MQHRGGRKLGPYQILREIGRGGMAIVYKAWQPSLDRYVALKVLPPAFVHNREFVARFQREARAVAKLSHPNIVHIYDTGLADGQYYIAMEHLEGGSLQELLKAGPLDETAALRVLSQVSRALDYAHDQGLIHRDIKPSNILFSADPRRVRDAVAKVTDFGIARAADGLELTRSGIIMGTPEYMAPEQAEGREVDYRADLYALGVVLYQMLTGQSAFRRSTPHATLHAVIYEQPPPPSKFRPGLPVATEKVLSKALAKRPGDRYQRGSALRRAYRSSFRMAGQQSVMRRGRSPLPWILAGAAGVMVLLLGLLLILSSDLGRSAAFTPQETSTIALQTSIAVRPTTALVPPSATIPATIAATPLSQQPSAIPDSETPVLPSSPPTLPVPALATPSGRLAFTSNRDGNHEIYLLYLGDGSLRRLTKSADDDWLPDWSPDGSQIAFTSYRRGSYDLWTMDGRGRGQRPLVATGAWDDYARWSPDGRRLAFSTTADNNSEIHVLQASGNLVRLTDTRAEDQWPDWSPDGQIVYTEGFKGSSNWDIHTINGDGSGGQLWLDGPTCDVQPTWSPDGLWIAFLRISRDTNGNGAVDEEDAGDVWVGRANGSELRKLVAGIWARTPAWSPDGRWIAFAQLRDSSGNGLSDGRDASDIWAVPLGGGELIPLVQSPHRDGDPSWAE